MSDVTTESEKCGTCVAHGGHLCGTCKWPLTWDVTHVAHRTLNRWKFQNFGRYLSRSSLSREFLSGVYPQLRTAPAESPPHVPHVPRVDKRAGQGHNI